MLPASVACSLQRAAMLVACMFAASSMVNAQQVITMKMAHLTVKSGQDHWAETLKAAIEKRAPGRMKIEIYPGGQLGSPSGMTQGAQLGTIEFIQNTPEFMTGIDPRLDAFTAPGVFDGIAHAHRAMHDPEVVQTLWSMFEPKGMKMIGIACEVTTDYGTHEPIRTVADFKGKKIRVLGSKLEIEQMRRLGATGVPVALPEVLTALQQKAIDGARTGIVLLVGFKFSSVIKNVLRGSESPICLIKIVNKRWFDGLPADLRAIITEEAARTDELNLPWNLDWVEKNYAMWKEQGGVINEFSKEERAEFLKRSSTVGDDVFKDNPPVKAAYETLKAAAARTRK
ncbi:MAG: TRAP transporter substrate-binding protein [Burkholderiales bacterium]